MKNKKYTFGGVTFEIESPFELLENDRSEAFRSESDADYLVRVVEVDDDVKILHRAEKNGNVFTRYMHSCPSGLNGMTLPPRLSKNTESIDHSLLIFSQ